MIVNFYIEVNRTTDKGEFSRLGELESWLIRSGFPFYNATDFDNYTNGQNSPKTLDEIRIAIEGEYDCE